MITGINIPAILIANMMGIAILFAVAVGDYWRTQVSAMENKTIVVIFIACLLSCIADPICFMADGKPGMLNRIFVFGGNTWLYLSEMVIGSAWLLLMTSHTGIRMKKTSWFFSIWLVGCIAVILLTVNVFVPVVFTVDENNVYARGSMSWFYFALLFGYVGASIVLYIYARKKSGRLMFFPMWAFVIPAVIGVYIQTVNYGLSTIVPFLTVSLSCVMACMQNEFLFRDKLTGLYNRYFLNTLQRRRVRRGANMYTAMMLDINGFKKINDVYGHKMGDKALVEFSNVLRSVVGMRGTAVRYAGDEFIIILNTQDDAQIDATVSDIHRALDTLNRESGNPYELSTAIGHCKLNLAENSMDEFMDEVDHMMYRNKREYYALRSEENRKRTELVG